MKYLYFNQNYLSNVPEYILEHEVLLVPEPWDFFKNKLSKFLCHLCLSPRLNSKIKIPFKNHWIKKILKNAFEKNDDICIIINSHFYNLLFTKIKRIATSMYRKVKFVFVFSDKVEYFVNNYKNFPSIEKLKEINDLVVTYNVVDSAKYDITLDRPCFPIYGEIENKLGDFSSDVFFVGSNKGRIEQIYKVFEFCSSKGLKCDFHVVGVPKEKIKYDNLISFNKPIPYSQVLERSMKTKCILYIVQDNGSGIVLRDYEAMHFNKLLLTNNYALKNTKLYSKDQVIWLEELEERFEVISKGYQGNNSVCDEYSFENWIKWIEEVITDVNK